MMSAPPNTPEINYKNDYAYVIAHEMRSHTSYFEKLDSPLSKIKEKAKYNFHELNIQIDMELEDIVNLLKEKESLLSLNDNWDDMGSSKISLEAWKGTSKFLLEYSKSIKEIYGYIIDTPKIYPSSNGSIDIQWETATYGLAINVDNTGTIAHFYTDDKDKQKHRGVFNPYSFNIHLLPKAIR